MMIRSLSKRLWLTILATDTRPRIEPALESLGLGASAGACPGDLSDGMRMRPSIAWAVVIRPRVMLMDEPFAAPDEITRARLNDGYRSDAATTPVRSTSPRATRGSHLD